MQVISQILKVKNYEYYIKHLELVNVIAPLEESLSKKEIEVLAAFMCQNKSLIEEDMFNGVVRKKVMEITGLKPGGLSNHLNSMLAKKFLVKNEVTKLIKAKSFLFPIDNGQGFRIKLIKVTAEQ